MSDNNQSIQSKRFKSREEKARKRMRHESNTQYRASLHAQKANGGGDKNAIQNKIDAISTGKHI